MTSMNPLKVISYDKLRRVANKVGAIPCTLCMIKGKTQTESIEAVKFGDYVYSLEKNNNQRSDRLSTHCIRVWVGDNNRPNLARWFYNKHQR